MYQHMYRDREMYIHIYIYIYIYICISDLFKTRSTIEPRQLHAFEEFCFVH